MEGTVGEAARPYGAGRGTVSSKGQITIPKSIRKRYALEPGTEVEFELRDDGALLHRKRGRRHPIWKVLGTFRAHWPTGVARDADAYIDWIRGGAYEPTGATGRPRKQKHDHGRRRKRSR